ncbi:pilin [Vibrio algicola]|uniref:Prepilin-type N-terminal cleavage/methylation domain-containing protein n=1 Tax=Vibrio algicola TaxID=2662262 RepID=A0A5Q0TBH9_9VIBR|nr:pilin [Vibrio algicola]
MKLQQGKKKLQKGFTLIELMIVVAVIGVLAAIAMPQYQKYIAKSEVASVLASLTGVKTNIEAYTVENGTFPTNAQSSALGIPTMDLGTASITSNSADSGTLTFTFGSVTTDASALVADKIITLSRTAGTGAWLCGTASGATGLDSDLLPKTCK